MHIRHEKNIIKSQIALELSWNSAEVELYQGALYMSNSSSFISIINGPIRLYKSFRLLER